MSKALSLLTGFIMFAGLGSACAAERLDAKTTDRLMQQSGLSEQLAAIAPQIRAGVAEALVQPGARVDEGELERWGRVVDVAYAPARLRTIVSEHLALTLSPAEASKVLAWLSSPPGKQVTRAEEAAARSADDLERTVQRGTEILVSASPARVQRLKRLVEASRSAEALVTIVIDSSLGIQQGIAKRMFGPGATAEGLAEAKAALEIRRADMLAEFAQVSLASFADTYVAIPDRVLDKYATFLETPAGTRFTQEVIAALDRALSSAAEEMGRQMGAAAGPSI